MVGGGGGTFGGALSLAVHPPPPPPEICHIMKYAMHVTSTYLGWLVVKHNKVSITDVETRQMIAGVLCIKDIFVGNICRSSSVICIPTIKEKRF